MRKTKQETTVKSDSAVPQKEEANYTKKVTNKKANLSESGISHSHDTDIHKVEPESLEKTYEDETVHEMLLSELERIANEPEMQDVVDIEDLCSSKKSEEPPKEKKKEVPAPRTSNKEPIVKKSKADATIGEKKDHNRPVAPKRITPKSTITPIRAIDKKEIEEAVDIETLRHQIQQPKITSEVKKEKKEEPVVFEKMVDKTSIPQIETNGQTKVAEEAVDFEATVSKAKKAIISPANKVDNTTNEAVFEISLNNNNQEFYKSVDELEDKIRKVLFEPANSVSEEMNTEEDLEEVVFEISESKEPEQKQSQAGDAGNISTNFTLPIQSSQEKEEDYEVRSDLKGQLVKKEQVQSSVNAVFSDSTSKHTEPEALFEVSSEAVNKEPLQNSESKAKDNSKIEIANEITAVNKTDLEEETVFEVSVTELEKEAAKETKKNTHENKSNKRSQKAPLPIENVNQSENEIIFEVSGI